MVTKSGGTGANPPCDSPQALPRDSVTFINSQRWCDGGATTLGTSHGHGKARGWCTCEEVRTFGGIGIVLLLHGSSWPRHEERKGGHSTRLLPFAVLLDDGWVPRPPGAHGPPRGGFAPRSRYQCVLYMRLGGRAAVFPASFLGLRPTVCPPSTTACVRIPHGARHGSAQTYMGVAPRSLCLHRLSRLPLVQEYGTAVPWSPHTAAA